MKYIFDEDSANDVALENRAYDRWVWGKRLQILRWFNPQKKQEAWNELYPHTDLAVYGLTEEQLSEINNTVY